ncbi:MAG TPA: hypothetical protein VGN37_14005 [Actinocatenispora sp.]
MIRRWGPVLMAAAGLTFAVSTPAAAGSAHSGGSQHSGKTPQSGGATTSQTNRAKRPNQSITFVRTPGRAAESIRATARGPVDGFGTAHIVDFTTDPGAATFQGTWELRFRTGTIQYRFTGTTTPARVAGRAALPASAAALPAAAPAPASSRDMAEPARSVVHGEFELAAGTGRFAGVTGTGTFHGFTLM